MTCSCEAHAPMVVSMGGLRCGRCARRLTQQQINVRMLVEITENNEAISSMIAGLQKFGLDKCEFCDEWTKAFAYIGDQCACAECLRDLPENVLGPSPEESEDVNPVEYADKAIRVVRAMVQRGFPVPVKNPVMRAAYKKVTAK